MGVKRICPNCKKTFITPKNARVFCTKRCAKYSLKKKQILTESLSASLPAPRLVSF